MSSGKKKGLGRGLSALFGDQQPKNDTKGTSSLNQISISDLSRNLTNLDKILKRKS